MLLGGHRSEPARCPQGHPLTAVARRDGMRRVCPACVADVLRRAEARESTKPTTVNDFLARLEGGEQPAFTGREAKSAAAFMRAAKELFGDGGVSDLRRTVRELAQVHRVDVREVMGWELATLERRLSSLSQVAA